MDKPVVVNRVLAGRKSRYKENMRKLFGENWRRESRRQKIFNIPEDAYVAQGS